MGTTEPADRKFLFRDDSLASIKQHNYDSDFANDDLFIKWLKDEPNSLNIELNVEAKLLSGHFGFNDLLGTFTIHALCEKPNADCSEGICFLFVWKLNFAKLLIWIILFVFFLLRYLLPKNTKRDLRHHKEIFRWTACEGRRNRIYV